MSPQRFDAHESASKVFEAAERGENPDCTFQEIKFDRDQMATFREMTKMHGADEHLPELLIDIGQAGKHIYPKGESAKENRCVIKPDREIPVGSSVLDSEFTINDVEKMEKEAGIDRVALEHERAENPEQPAEQIENLADKALDGDQKSNLELRKKLERLMNDPNKDYRENVLNQLIKDGEYFSTESKVAPNVKIEADESGYTSITFDRIGKRAETFPLNKSVDEQVDEAQQEYRNGLKLTESSSMVGADSRTLADEILQGKHVPSNLKWFMIARQEAGKPVVDLFDKN